MRKLKLFSLALMALFSTGLWADSVTFSASDMSEKTSGNTKGQITVYCPTKASDQQAYKSGSTVKYSAISLGSSADTAVIVPQSGKSIQFRVAAGYKITGISIFAAANKDSICGEPIVIWDGEINHTPAYVGTIEAPARNGESDPDPIVVTNIPNGATAFALYRRIKYNSSTGEIGSGSNFGRSQQTWNIFSVTVTYETEASYTISYDANGGTGTMDNTTNTVAACTFGAPDGMKFGHWEDEDGTTYAVGTNVSKDVDLIAIWVDDLPDPTATFANGTYIIGAGALDMSAKFSSNSTGSVTYALKEASANASITSAGAFTATSAGSYVVVASQVATASYAAITKEATVTVLDDELSDIYRWAKSSDYGGDALCISSSAANTNANANAASTTLNYSSLTMSGITAMGRATAANTDVLLTFTATQEGFAIKSICTYGKLEENNGAEYSWDGGTTWTALAKYTTQAKKEFEAPAGEYPETFKLRFKSVSTSSGGLWWRNALVTLEPVKTISSTSEALQNVKINGTPISSSNLASLLEDKSLDIATEYPVAPTVTFVKRTTTNYEGGWASTYKDKDEDVVAEVVGSKWSASKTINAQAYTVTLAQPTEPILATETTAMTFVSTKISKDTKTFTFSGANLEDDVTISLESAVAGFTISPTNVTPTDGTIADQEVTVSYKSLENVASANVNLIVRYSDDVKKIIALTYSSTEGFDEVTPISASTTWNWNNANSSESEIESIDNNAIIVLANVDGWANTFNARALSGRLQFFYRESKYAQGHNLKFNTTVPGKLTITYSNTGNRKDSDPARAPRITDATGTYSPTTGSKSASAGAPISHNVAAGDVFIEGFEIKDGSPVNMLRFYEVKFDQIFAVNCATPTNGTLEADTTLAIEGETITLTVTPDPSYVIAGVTVDGEALVADQGVYSFAMPAKNVTVSATFAEKDAAPISWSAETGKAYLPVGAKAGTLPALTNESSLDVTYSSTDEAKATIDASTGVITPVATGATTIKATYTATAEGAYKTTVAEYTLNVYGVKSMAISGDATVTEYAKNDAFDFAGLTATATFDDDETEDVTGVAEWLADPATITEAGNVNVTASLGGKTSAAKVVAVTITATGIDNIDVDAKAVKVLENGMLIIEKNGVRYNAMGQMIK